MDKKPYTIDDEITDTEMKRPHVVILGAGASLAATPGGDRNGKQLPLMANFVETLDLAQLLKQHGIRYRKGMNFETMYSRLASKPELAQTRTVIERAIYTYFEQLQLPDGPNVYDHLILSLREKDLIATFNWDPFLYQACHRNRNAAKQPHVVYLHGSVATGYCLKDRKKGIPGVPCSACKRPFVASKLLYPVAKKNYNTDTFISAEWRCLESYLQNAYLITFFGYGAPKSDTEAVGLMKTAWGAVEDRRLEQTEVIDIRPHDELADLWSPFIHSHHYDVHQSLYTSWLARHPRRTCEAAWQQFMECQYLGDHPFPPGSSLTDMQAWIAPMVAAEDYGICGDLGISHPLLEVLDHWPGSEPVVLCIDALDASRGGPTERAVNALIEAVIARLSDRWRVLASIRTFDLKMGTRYRELFAGNAPAAEFTELGLRDVRHVLVTPWSDNELASLLSQAPLIAAVINTSPSALRELIRVPFNSRLLAALLDDGRPADSFANVQGQADLLATFWDRRVLPLGAGAHAALSKAIDLMIERRRLQARYVDLASHAGFPSTLHAAILVPVAEDRYITFRHHILFDYAVSRLLLDPFDLPALQATLSHQRGLGLLLAPALAYSLEALWRQDDSSRATFWTLFLELAANKNIDPIARVVITRLGAELPHSASDVAGLAHVISSAQEYAAAVSALVGGVLAATTRSRSAAPWKTLTATLAARAASYAGACRSLLLWVLDTPEAEDDSKLGTAARLLLEHALGRADYWRSLTISGIEATARTFAADPKASRQTLDRLFDSEHLARHAQDEMPWLCRHMARIYQHDPDFAADIYVRVFAHEVTDQTSTPMSQSQILSLSSNPRQDYRMAYWGAGRAISKVSLLSSNLCHNGAHRRSRGLRRSRASARGSRA